MSGTIVCVVFGPENDVKLLWSVGLLFCCPQQYLVFTFGCLSLLSCSGHLLIKHVFCHSETKEEHKFAQLSVVFST